VIFVDPSCHVRAANTMIVILKRTLWRAGMPRAQVDSAESKTIPKASCITRKSRQLWNFTRRKTSDEAQAAQGEFLTAVRGWNASALAFVG
jgi:hypothetical protein